MTHKELEESFLANFGNLKGFISYCYLPAWTVSNTKKYDKLIRIYVSNVECIKYFPEEFHGVSCEYIICPNGINCGCD